MTNTLYACSTNPGKLKEFALAARYHSFACAVIEPLPNLADICPPEEAGRSFEENARLKAYYYSSFTSGIVFADDSGLEVDALGGAPGIYSARYAGPGANDSANNKLLLQKLCGETNRQARFVCAIAAAHAGQVLYTAHAAVEGEILTSLRGENGFGYDPLFLYPPLQRSLAEIGAEQKFAISHRGKAMRELLRWFGERFCGHTR
ncbi:MAG: RdgB/HAM1 family non-canonical purine NTP pyrophosphatase [Acidobacteriaceae bacterium]|nr:RdgB/HAM1 family non-canonical purine NTP pyrophosphatase [Acidobacteriaceae bacterium]